ncbi:hypothetical protein M8494_11305 [Serratia ureilytica]
MTISKRKALAEQGECATSISLIRSIRWTGDRFHLPVSCCGKARKTGALQKRGSLCLPFPTCMLRGEIDEARFRLQCDEYGADADKALSWYYEASSVRATAKFTRFMSRKAAACGMWLPIEARRCAIIDPVLDLTADRARSRINRPTISWNFIHQRGGEWPGCWIRTARRPFSAATAGAKTGAFTGIGEKITAVQGCGKKIYNLKTCLRPIPSGMRCSRTATSFYRQPAR